MCVFQKEYLTIFDDIHIYNESRSYKNHTKMIRKVKVLFIPFLYDYISDYMLINVMNERYE